MINLSIEIRKGDRRELEFEVSINDIVYLTNIADSFIFTVKQDINCDIEIIKKTFTGDGTSKIIFDLSETDTDLELGQYKYDLFWNNQKITPIVSTLLITEVVHNV